MGRSSRVQLGLISAWVFTALLLLPLFILLLKLPGGFSLELSHGFWWALRNTILQATGSALLGTGLGAFVGFSLLTWPQHSVVRIILEKVMLAPTFLPTLFSLMICLSVIDPFPFGTVGISLVHAFINMGLIGVSFAREIERDLSGMTQLAWIEGASKSQLLWALRVPLLKKLRTAFFFVFAICFSSFTVPLIVGGGRGTTLEVLIYERVRLDGDFGAALSLSLFQSVFVLLVSLAFLRRSRNLIKQSEGESKLLQIKWGSWLLALGSATIFAELLSEAYAGWERVQSIPGLWQQILELTMPSLGTMALVVSSASFLFVWQLSLYSWWRFQSFATGFAHLSPSLIGFSFLLWFGNGSTLSLVLALTLLFYSSLWRLFAFEPLQSLSTQTEVAELLGASKFQIVKELLIPQMLPAWQQMMGVLCVWTLGEFAISKLVLGREGTLGILAGNLMSSYRIQASVFLLFWILGFGSLFYFLLSVGVYVSRSKSS